MNNKQFIAVWALIIGSIVFGLGSIIVSYVNIGSYAIAFWRMLIATVTFFIANLFIKQAFPHSKKAIILALLSGVFLAFDLAFWHESIHAVGPGIATLLNSLQIFFLTAIGFFIFKEKPVFSQLLSLFLAIVGIALIASTEFHQNHYAIWGFVMGVSSGLMLALSMSAIRKLHEFEATAMIPLMIMINLAGAIVLLPLAITDKGNFITVNWEDISLILVYGVIVQCGAWTMIAFAINRLSLALTGLLLLTEPVAAILIDFFILDKPISHVQWIGATITLIAIYIGTLKRA